MIAYVALAGVLGAAHVASLPQPRGLLSHLGVPWFLGLAASPIVCGVVPELAGQPGDDWPTRVGRSRRLMGDQLLLSSSSAPRPLDLGA